MFKFMSYNYHRNDPLSRVTETKNQVHFVLFLIEFYCATYAFSSEYEIANPPFVPVPDPIHCHKGINCGYLVSPNQVNYVTIHTNP